MTAIWKCERRPVLRRCNDEKHPQHLPTLLLFTCTVTESNRALLHSVRCNVIESDRACSLPELQDSAFSMCSTIDLLGMVKAFSLGALVCWRPTNYKKAANGNIVARLTKLAPPQQMEKSQFLETNRPPPTNTHTQLLHTH